MNLNLNKKIKAFISKNILVIFCFVFFVLYSAYFLNKNAKNIGDWAYFGGDTWEYQSVAVNFMKGHGLKFGEIEKFKKYRFKVPSSIEEEYRMPFKEAGEKAEYDFYRAPGYPVFLSIVYKIFGVHPGIAKLIQLLMLIFVAAFLPMVGYYFWGKNGYGSGVLAGIIFLHEWNGIYTEILTEPMIIFGLFLVMLSYISFEKRKSFSSSILLGLSLAMIFLTKGSVWFIPFIFFGFILFQQYKNIIKNKMLIGVMITAFALPVILYSVFVSVKSGKFVLVTTQGSQVILDGNNEKSIISGAWEPSGTTDPDGFYEKNKSLPTSSKVFIFYRERLTSIPSMVVNKISAGFGSFPFLFLLLVLINTEIIYLLSRKVEKGKKQFLFSVGVVLYIVCLYIFYNIAFLILGALMLYIAALYLRININKSIPAPFVMIFANFLALTIITFGHSRFTMVTDMFFILLAVNYVSLFFHKIKGIESSGAMEIN